MAVSYATQHKQAHQKARQDHDVIGSGVGEISHSNTYKTQLVKLEIDRTQLSNIRSLHRKQTFKREILASYADYIQFVINQDSGSQDEILVTVLIWSIDAGEYSKALLMADYALRHKLRPPDNFTRNLSEVITEELSTQVLKSETPADFLGWLQQLEALTVGADMVDVVQAKFHKALGLSLQADAPEQALEQFRKAHVCHSGASVKRLINRLEKQLAEVLTNP